MLSRHSLLVCLLAGLLSSSTASNTYDYSNHDSAAPALVFEARTDKPNFGNCDGVYFVTSYLVNGRVVYVNEAKSRFLAYNTNANSDSGGFWTIGSLKFLPSILEGQNSFSGLQHSINNHIDELQFKWDEYVVWPRDVAAIGFSKKFGYNIRGGAEGLYLLSPYITTTFEPVYINDEKNKFLVRHTNGWVIDEMSNLGRTLPHLGNINQNVRQRNPDVSQGWAEYYAAPSKHYAIDIDSAQLRGRFVVRGAGDAGDVIYRSEEEVCIIFFHPINEQWEVSGSDAAGDFYVPKDSLLAGSQWQPSAVSVLVNYRMAGDSILPAPSLCEDLCARSGGLHVEGSDKCLFTAVDTVLAWEDAGRYCEMHGGVLASIDSDDENQGVASLFQLHRGQSPAWDGKLRMWIGASDLSEEGAFAWADGSPLAYDRWAAGEPNDSGDGEDCAEVRMWSGNSWNDNQCSKAQPFVCERPWRPPPASC